MATVPNKPVGLAQQEWQVVYDVTANDSSACTTIAEAQYSVLRRHAGPLREPAISLLQQAAARKVLQRGCASSLKPRASGGDREAWAADTHVTAASSSAASHDAAILPASGGGGQDQAAPQPSDWEFI